MTPDHMLRDYRVNAVGPALVAKHFLPPLPKDRRVVFASPCRRGLAPSATTVWAAGTANRASKAALNMILRNLAIETARSHPLTVIAGLHPGTVATDLSAPFQKGVATEKLFAPAYSAARLLAVLDGLTPADSGGVFAWDGARIPE